MKYRTVAPPRRCENCGQKYQDHSDTSDCPPVPPPADAAPREEAPKCRHLIDRTVSASCEDVRATWGCYCLGCDQRSATPPGGDGGTSPEALREAARYLVEHATELDPEARRILYENRWGLYDGDALAARAPTGSGPDAATEAHVEMSRAISDYGADPCSEKRGRLLTAIHKYQAESVSAALRATGAGAGEPTDADRLRYIAENPEVMRPLYDLFGELYQEDATGKVKRGLLKPGHDPLVAIRDTLDEWMEGDARSGPPSGQEEG